VTDGAPERLATAVRAVRLNLPQVGPQIAPRKHKGYKLAQKHKISNKN